MAFLSALSVPGRWLCAAVLSLGMTAAQAGPTEYEVKAAFVYQIAKFVEWPPSNAPLRLCVLGGNPFGAALESIRGKPVNERKLEVLLLGAGADLHECTVLFVASAAERHLDRAIALARGAAMLTVGDTEGFARRGTMVNFFMENGKVRFEINQDAVRQGGLKISSKLLALARIVDPQQDR